MASKTSATNIQAAERTVLAVKLRLAGKTYQEIGKALGITKQAAHKIIRAALEDLRREAEEEAQTLRTIEASRLDVAQAAIWTKVIAGDLGAIDRYLRIAQRRAALLGLDAAIQQEVTHLGGVQLVEVHLDKKE